MKLIFRKSPTSYLLFYFIYLFLFIIFFCNIYCHYGQCNVFMHFRKRVSGLSFTCKSK
jgi:hypothetical protein